MSRGRANRSCAVLRASSLGRCVSRLPSNLFSKLPTRTHARQVDRTLQTCFDAHAFRHKGCKTSPAKSIFIIIILLFWLTSAAPSTCYTARACGSQCHHLTVDHDSSFRIRMRCVSFLVRVRLLPKAVCRVSTSAGVCELRAAEVGARLFCRKRLDQCWTKSEAPLALGVSLVTETAGARCFVKVVVRGVMT